MLFLLIVIFLILFISYNFIKINENNDEKKDKKIDNINIVLIITMIIILIIIFFKILINDLLIDFSEGTIIESFLLKLKLLLTFKKSKMTIENVSKLSGGGNNNGIIYNYNNDLPLSDYGSDISVNFDI
jgi:Na+/H+ antiporter NhaC